jgi:hypothetical protein
LKKTLNGKGHIGTYWVAGIFLMETALRFVRQRERGGGGREREREQTGQSKEVDEVRTRDGANM